MKKLHIVIVTATISTIIGAATGWISHAHKGDGCMCPWPTIPIIFSIIYGICGLKIGLCLSPIVIATDTAARNIKASRKWYKASERDDPASSLLRPSLIVDSTPETLLRPSQGSPDVQISHLLRASAPDE